MMLKCLNRFSFTVVRRAASSSSTALMYKERGEPENVVTLVQRDLGPLREDEVLVKMCAAPIHPSDINTIQGVYPIKPPLPAVPGNEGVGRVIACGSKVDSLHEGDLVIPSILASGTWQTHFHAKPQDLLRLSHPLPIANAAIFSTNPGTAYRMLMDFADLRPGDIVIQNGSTSAVGIYVIQLAKLLGLRTVNLFRPRNTDQATEEMRQVLRNYGATWALTEAELNDRSNSLTKDIAEAGPVKLALNCLGGKPALSLLRALGDEGTLVSYGAMTRNPMPIPVGPMIFRDIRLRGFWLSNWIRREPRPKRQAMLDQLATWFTEGVLRPSPFITIPFSEWKQAINLTTFNDNTPTEVKKKVILTME